MTALFACWAALACMQPAWAGDTARALLEEFRDHGFSSPRVALQRLRATPAPAADAPLDLRWRYQAAVAWHALRLREDTLAAAALAELGRMAAQERCEPCRVELLLRREQAAELANDTAQLRQLLQQIAAMPLSADPQLAFEQLSAQASGNDVLGEYDAAIAAAVRASELAVRERRPADQATMFNLLVRSNAGRRDLQRAVALAGEGYALARQIGFTYMMVMLRANEAYARATLKEGEPRRAPLHEILRLARSTTGLEHVELNTLINLAAFHNDVHEYDKAVHWAEQAQALALKRHDEDSRAFAIVNRGVALVHLGQADAGVAMVREGVAITEKLGLKLEVADLQAQLVDALEAAGRPREALVALRRQVALSQELTRTQRDKDVLSLQERFSAERKTREIERLQLENARRAAELAATTSQQRLWAATAVALTLGALMLAQWLGRARQRARALEVDNAKLSEQSSHDPLTGAYNRRYCDQLMLRHTQRLQARGAMDAQAGVGLMLVDVDFFKGVNDTHGHAAGDQVLVEVARRLQGLLREQDAVVRWGGEEFVLVLPATPREALPVVAERVLGAIATEPVFLAGGQPLGVQVSGGCVAWPMFAGQPWEDALHLADLALYQSKAGGRNRATCLMAVAERAQLERVRSDLAAARDAGEVVLQTVAGPAALPQHPATLAAA
ncbi:GGDEF domain-containing protein [Ideonella sp. BN130291]|uniref:GGDEF domain-containing protein n=1 Tax=Ideonella sp. BN130291 TaxID=3112940 RepID=UPI002E2529EE|nr:GGDEF domain-containing protein [Ideonella sp. BN130291]